MNYDECKKRNIPFFFSMAVDNAWILNSLINLGVCAARITGQLTHQLDYINTLPIEIRVWANNPGAPFNYEPIIGGWFRPEDLYQLEAIDVCEFDAKDNRQEQALYRIYAERHEWPGELYILINSITDQTIMNRMIPPEFQQRRSNCNMKCQSGSHCHFCYMITHLANPEILKPIKDKIKNV